MWCCINIYSGRKPVELLLLPRTADFSECSFVNESYGMSSMTRVLRDAAQTFESKALACEVGSEKFPAL